MFSCRNIVRRSIKLRSLTSRSCSQASTSQKSPVSQDETETKYETIKISTKLQKKSPARKPIVKNFFLNEVETDLLAFPEVIPRDDISTLYNQETSTQKFFQDYFDNERQKDSLTDEVYKEMVQHQLMGLNIPQHLGGRGYYVSESLIASEPESVDCELSSNFLTHRAVVDAIKEFGTEEQNKYWLPRMSKGLIIATDAIFEEVNPESRLFNTTADGMGDQFILNGTKSFIVNGRNANLFCVLAQTKPDIGLVHSEGVTAFLVEASMAGVTKKASNATISGRGSQCDVIFKEVQLGKEHIIGRLHDGNRVAQALLRSTRLRTGLLVTGLMKNFLSVVSRHCISTKTSGVSFKELEFIKEKLSRVACTTYAIESMTYYTAGLIDEFEKQDTDVEAAILKIYSQQSLWSTITDAMGFLGPKCLHKGEPLEQLLRDAAQLNTQGETLDSLRLFVGLSGLHHSGISLQDTVRKERNPLFHPGHIISKLLERSSLDNPTLNLQISQYLHPSLEPAANWLEQSIVRLHLGTQILLTRYGTSVIEKHVDILRLTDCAVILYAMFSSLSRASRSYCIGLKCADYEMLLATMLCLEGKNKIFNLMTDVQNGQYVTNDNNHMKIAKQIFNSGGYFSEHPLKYNY